MPDTFDHLDPPSRAVQAGHADAARPPSSGCDGGARLSFALYRAANRMVRLHKPFLEPLGLTFPQYLVMLELLNGAPRAVGEIGAHLGLDSGTLTPLLKRLEGAGMVTRRRDPDDERRVLVDLTDASRAAGPDIRAVNDRLHAACALCPTEVARMRQTLDVLRHLGDDPSPRPKP